MKQPARKRTAASNTLVVLGLIAVVVILGGIRTTQRAAVGSLTNMSWASSSNVINAASQQYAWNFTTATTGTLTKVTFSVPAATAGTATNVAVYGLGAGTWSGPTAGLITYTVTSPQSVTSGTSVYLAANGITNTSATGAFSSQISTYISGPTLNDQGTANSITFVNGTTAVTVAVPESMTFANNTTAFTMLPVPGGSAVTSAVQLSVQTNAASGYTLSASNTALTNGTTTIAEMGTGGAASLTIDQFAAQGAATGGASMAAAYGSSHYVGYGSSSTQIASDGSATGATTDTVTLTNALQIDYAIADGSYSSTITYTVTPSY